MDVREFFDNLEKNKSLISIKENYTDKEPELSNKGILPRRGTATVGTDYRLSCSGAANDCFGWERTFVVWAQ